MIGWITKIAKVFTEAPVTTTVSSILLTFLLLWIALLLFDFCQNGNCPLLESWA